ncbi:MAG: hypothetical protein NVS3B5_01890 [Sphingomicrobium sp.]
MFFVSLVELTSYGAKLRLTGARQICSAGEILAQQPVGIFIGSALPGASGIAKIEIHVGRKCEALMVEQWIRLNGLEGTRIDRSIARLFRGPREFHDERDSTTPVAMVRLLKKLDRGEALKGPSRSLLLDLMSCCATGTHRIRALLPIGTRLGDKTGTLSGLTTDVGLISMPDRHKVAIAIFARGESERQPGMAAAARKVYDSFHSPLGAVAAHLISGDLSRSEKTTTTLMPSLSDSSAVIGRLPDAHGRVHKGNEYG